MHPEANDPTTPRAPSPAARALVTWWALLGVVGILANAAVSLGDRGVATVRSGLAPRETAALVALTLLFVLGEGVLALQRRWGPHVIERIRRLRARPRPLAVLLAPLYAMGLIGGAWVRLLRTWAGVLAIVAAVLVVREFPEPWRGIVDFAVAAALAWGALTLAAQGVRAFR